MGMINKISRSRAAVKYGGAFLLLLLSISDSTEVDSRSRRSIKEYQLDYHRSTADTIGTRWAVLVAGSKGYYNYRHQADVCHAYQILKQGGLKDENIIVFMYDDIAYSKDNPTPGFIINKPYGPDVYHGVPKDYTGNDTNVDNLYAVLLGNRSALTGGSGKVLSSGPNDHVFFYFTDHGGPGVLEMPVGNLVYAKDLIDVVKKKHENREFKRMVIYIEACESGSMVDGLLPDDVNVYATSASKPDENSWGWYCPGDDDELYGKHNFTATPGSPDYYGTCLGDLYSIAWLEDSDTHNPRKETLKQQYNRVKKRTNASHVMQYGDMDINEESRSIFMGPGYPSDHLGTGRATSHHMLKPDLSSSSATGLVSQREAKIAYLRHKVINALEGSIEKVEAQKRLQAELLHRKQVDGRMKEISKLVFAEKDGLVESNRVRPEGQSLVNDWECFKSMLRTYEQHCGALSHYGRKYTRVIANMCNAGMDEERLVRASTEVCSPKLNK